MRLLVRGTSEPPAPPPPASEGNGSAVKGNGTAAVMMAVDDGASTDYHENSGLRKVPLKLAGINLGSQDNINTAGMAQDGSFDVAASLKHHRREHQRSGNANSSSCNRNGTKVDSVAAPFGDFSGCNVKGGVFFRTSNFRRRRRASSVSSIAAKFENLSQQSENMSMGGGSLSSSQQSMDWGGAAAGGGGGDGAAAMSIGSSFDGGGMMSSESEASLPVAMSTAAAEQTNKTARVKIRVRRVSASLDRSEARKEEVETMEQQQDYQYEQQQQKKQKLLKELHQHHQQQKVYHQQQEQQEIFHQQKEQLLQKEHFVQQQQGQKLQQQQQQVRNELQFQQQQHLEKEQLQLQQQQQLQQHQQQQQQQQNEVNLEHQQFQHFYQHQEFQQQTVEQQTKHLASPAPPPTATDPMADCCEAEIERVFLQQQEEDEEMEQASFEGDIKEAAAKEGEEEMTEESVYKAETTSYFQENRSSSFVTGGSIVTTCKLSREEDRMVWDQFVPQNCQQQQQLQQQQQQQQQQQHDALVLTAASEEGRLLTEEGCNMSSLHSKFVDLGLDDDLENLIEVDPQQVQYHYSNSEMQAEKNNSPEKDGPPQTEENVQQHRTENDSVVPITPADTDDTAECPAFDALFEKTLVDDEEFESMLDHRKEEQHQEEKVEKTQVSTPSGDWMLRTPSKFVNKDIFQKSYETVHSAVRETRSSNTTINFNAHTEGKVELKTPENTAIDAANFHTDDKIDLPAPEKTFEGNATDPAAPAEDPCPRQGSSLTNFSEDTYVTCVDEHNAEDVRYFESHVVTQEKTTTETKEMFSTEVENSESVVCSLEEKQRGDIKNFDNVTEEKVEPGTLTKESTEAHIYENTYFKSGHETKLDNEAEEVFREEKIRDKESERKDLDESSSDTVSVQEKVAFWKDAFRQGSSNTAEKLRNKRARNLTIDLHDLPQGSNNSCASAASSSSTLSTATATWSWNGQVARYLQKSYSPAQEQQQQQQQQQDNIEEGIGHGLGIILDKLRNIETKLDEIKTIEQGGSYYPELEFKDDDHHQQQVGKFPEVGPTPTGAKEDVAKDAEKVEEEEDKSSGHLVAPSATPSASENEEEEEEGTLIINEENDAETDEEENETSRKTTSTSYSVKSASPSDDEEQDRDLDDVEDIKIEILTEEQRMARIEQIAAKILMEKKMLALHEAAEDKALDTLSERSEEEGDKEPQQDSDRSRRRLERRGSRRTRSASRDRASGLAKIKYCWRCHRTGHESFDCRKEVKPGNWCPRCLEANHWENECWVNDKQVGNNFKLEIAFLASPIHI